MLPHMINYGWLLFWYCLESGPESGRDSAPVYLMPVHKITKDSLGRGLYSTCIRLLLRYLESKLPGKAVSGLDLNIVVIYRVRADSS